MLVVLGIIIGLLIAILNLALVARFQAPINRAINRFASMTKVKGEILEPKNEEVDAWVASLKDQ